ncbi:Lytic transglycosylase-like SLT domain [Phaffia rhodozyma]|uniref:Lytic transglycosylase-like SLT domain n=1 Tax=Phaffia rhodozyma TaxID=264483 RepID=A0A0F7SVC1_PHARH|nr:Lytic transglycosylase-like SLT domain [Phaffia rhodozyma]
MVYPSTVLFALALSLSTTSLVSAAGSHGSSIHLNHNKVLANVARKAGFEAHQARILEENLATPKSIRKRDGGRCKTKISSNSNDNSSSSSSAFVETPSSTQTQAQAQTSIPAVNAIAKPTATSSVWQEASATTTSSAWQEASTTSVWQEQPSTSSGAWRAAATTTSAWQAPAQVSVSVSIGGSGNILNINDLTCGWSGATEDSPNGSQEWLNCGVNGAGWTPPFVAVGELKTVDLKTAIGQSGSVFAPCAPYVDIMYSVGEEFNIPPIMIAAFAMQESTCQPGVVGQGGEQGLMQISKDKCANAPGGNCQDPWYNIHTSVSYFASTLNGNGGNVLLAIGTYNGWYSGLTYSSATAARWSSCCRCQNNLDYLYSFTNGFLQGKNGYSMGSIQNLAVC